MKAFTNNTFKGRWPVPTAAVVYADSAGDAAMILEAMLDSAGLTQHVPSSDMIELTSSGVILSDGDY